MKKNGKKKNGNQIFYCHPCQKQFQLLYQYKGAAPRTKRLVRSMSFNGSGIRDIQRVLGLSIAGILLILRMWFKTIEEQFKTCVKLFNLTKPFLYSPKAGQTSQPKT